MVLVGDRVRFSDTGCALLDTEPNAVPGGGCSERPVRGLEGMGGHCEHVIRQGRVSDGSDERQGQVSDESDDEEEDERLTAAHRVLWAAVQLVTARVVPTDVLRERNRNGHYHKLKKSTERAARAELAASRRRHDAYGQSWGQGLTLEGGSVDRDLCTPTN